MGAVITGASIVGGGIAGFWLGVAGAPGDYVEYDYDKQTGGYYEGEKRASVMWHGCLGLAAAGLVGRTALWVVPKFTHATPSPLLKSAGTAAVAAGLTGAAVLALSAIAITIGSSR